MKKKDLVVIIIFISFLFIPSILYWCLENKMDITNYENRELYTKPEFLYSNIIDYPKKYEDYFNDNLAFKNEIRKIRSNFLYKIFNVSSNNKVIIDNDWMFYNSDYILDGDTIRAYQRLSKYTDEEKENIKNDLSKTKEKLQEKNIDFYILAVPNKENIYTDRLKKYIKISDNKYSKTEDLISYLNNNNINVVYPKEELIKNRKNIETYYKTDTHWNNYGAYIGVIELMKAIDKNFEIPNIKMEFENYSGDLAKMNLLTIEEKEPIINNFYANIKYNCEGDEYKKICESKKPIYDITILFVGDSFRTATIQYLAKLYKKSIFIHRNHYDKDYIKENNSSIVVYEIVERYSYDLNKSSILLN